MQADVSASACYSKTKEMSNYPYYDPAINNFRHDMHSWKTVNKMARMTRTAHTGLVPSPTIARESYRGTRVCMHLINGKWQPVDGRFVKMKMGNLEVNILCHNTDKDPPNNYKIG